MLEFILRALKLVLSKETREQARTLADVLTRSPEWLKEVQTFEARISTTDRDRTRLLRDLVVRKLNELDYNSQSINAFKIVSEELVANAFEHGAKETKSGEIRILCDISPTYVAITVFNPVDVSVNLPAWVNSAASNLRETDLFGRGRGLLTVYRKADVLEALNDESVKATIYRDTIEFEQRTHGHAALINILSGHTNPALGRRLIEYLERIDSNELVVCLDPLGISEAMGFDTHTWHSVLKYAKEQALAGDKSVRIVCDDDDIRDMLPSDFVFSSVRAAIDSLGSN